MSERKPEAQFLLGKLASPDSQRDAGHIAFFPACCAEEFLYPGARVKLVPGTTNRIRETVNPEDPGIGVVDPFLPESLVKEGQWVYVLLYPGTVTGLRHHYEIPEIDNQKEMSEEEIWLRDFADRWGMDFDEIVRVGRAGNDCIWANGTELHYKGELGEDHELFWKNLEKFLKTTFSKKHRNSIKWTCTC